MKEATGELSTTVIAVVAIGLIATLFATIVLPMIRTQINAQIHCVSAVNCDCGEEGEDNANAVCTCHYYVDDGDGKSHISEDTIQCPNKNGDR